MMCVSIMTSMKPQDRANLSGYLRDEFNLGTRTLLDRETLSRILARPSKTLPDRLSRLLDWCVKKQPVPGNVLLFESEATAISYSQTPRDTIYLLNYLCERGYLKRVSADGQWQVTIDGYIENEKEEHSTNSHFGFVAMWFDPSMSDVRELGLSAGILGAGFSPTLVNNVEHVNKIDDEIVAQIRKSRFLVADFTGHRGGVYFEAGFALGLGLPVFWTCRKDDLKDLHFDIRQYNCIDWQTPDELAGRLQKRIEAVIGSGPFS